MGLEGGAIDDVNRALKQAGNVIPQSHVIENGDVRLGINVDDDVEVAVGTVLAARDRPEDSIAWRMPRARKPSPWRRRVAMASREFMLKI